MSDDIRSMIPSFGNKQPKDKRLQDAKSILQNQGLLPKDTINKVALTEQDDQLAYVLAVYAELRVGNGENHTT